MTVISSNMHVVLTILAGLLAVMIAAVAMLLFEYDKASRERDDLRHEFNDARDRITGLQGSNQHWADQVHQLDARLKLEADIYDLLLDQNDRLTVENGIMEDQLAYVESNHPEIWPLPDTVPVLPDIDSDELDAIEDDLVEAFAAAGRDLPPSLNPAG